MKAMILAAGRGERMRPLTDTCPKPLIKVQGKALIEYHLEKLAAAGITDIVINLAWLGEDIRHYLGKGERWQVNIHYSDEQDYSGGLETAGGIIHALPLLTEVGKSDEFFLVINADIFTELNYQQLVKTAEQLQAKKASGQSINAHLLLVANPEHNPEGDFVLSDGFNSHGLLTNKTAEPLAKQASYTFSGIGLYHADFFASAVQEYVSGDALPLGSMLRAGARQQGISAQVLNNYWLDVGTPERLEQLTHRLAELG